MIAVMVLLYGDHAPLARRCLDSLLPGTAPSQLFIGINTVAPATRQYLQGLIDQGRVLPENIYDAGYNAHKYPMLRWMLAELPATFTHVMWFDDDSFVLRPAPSFLGKALQQLGDCAMLGSRPYTMPLQKAQWAWVQDQPWYQSRPVGARVTFCTGGWWLIPRQHLVRFNYPWPELDHRGGDVLWGACLHQNQLAKAHQQPALVAVNADDYGRESKSARRGFDQRPLGADYTRGTPLPQITLPSRRVPFSADTPTTLPSLKKFSNYQDPLV